MDQEAHFPSIGPGLWHPARERVEKRQDRRFRHELGVLRGRVRLDGVCVPALRSRFDRLFPEPVGDLRGTRCNRHGTVRDRVVAGDGRLLGADWAVQRPALRLARGQRVLRTCEPVRRRGGLRGSQAIPKGAVMGIALTFGAIACLFAANRTGDETPPPTVQRPLAATEAP